MEHAVNKMQRKKKKTEELKALNSHGGKFAACSAEGTQR